MTFKSNVESNFTGLQGLKLPHDFWMKFGNSDYSGLEISNDRQHEKEEEKITDILVIAVCW